MMLAFAISPNPNTFGSTGFTVEDEIANSLGTLKAYYLREGYDNIQDGRLELDLVPCPDDLSVEGFYPVVEHQEYQIFKIKPLLKCVDVGNLTIRGNFNTSPRQQLVIELETCNPARPDCEAG